MRNILRACAGATTPFGRSWTVAGLLIGAVLGDGAAHCSRLGSFATILAFAFFQYDNLLRAMLGLPSPPNEDAMTRTITLFHAPHSRSGAVRILLEELGAPYILQTVNLKANETRAPAYLARNPMGKVPALLVEQDGGESSSPSRRPS
jgi:hypothetical protein